MDFKQRALDAIEIIKTFPESKELKFLEDSEWLDQNFEKPFFNIRQPMEEIAICKDCHEKAGEYWDTPKCPGLTTILNVENSKLNRCISFKKKFCKFRLAADGKSKRDLYLKDSGVIADGLEQFTLDNYKADYHPICCQAKKTCETYISKFLDLGKRGIGIYIYNPKPSTGKTHLSIATAQEITKKYNIPFKYIHSFTFFRNYRAGLNRFESDFDTSAFQYVDELAEYHGLLIFDDFGKEKVTEANIDLLYSIISNRVTNNLPTIYNSCYCLKPVDIPKHSDQNMYPLKQKYLGVTGADIISKIQGTCKILDISVIPSKKGEVDF